MCSVTERSALCDVLQQCNVRVVYADGDYELSYDIRTPLQVLNATRSDVTIACIQYCFNGNWVSIELK